MHKQKRYSCTITLIRPQRNVEPRWALATRRGECWLRAPLIRGEPWPCAQASAGCAPRPASPWPLAPAAPASPWPLAPAAPASPWPLVSSAPARLCRAPWWVLAACPARRALGESPSLVLDNWWNPSTNLFTKCRLNEVGTCQVMEQVLIIVVMVMTTRWCST